ncbi:glycosyltransferase family 39 protein [Paraburkholderia sp. J41]|uniref:glycosyltransferase family 39 protein n=1 Tax=Paraburkholderia sp. J41 TaxID=2805433 RepID=UPI002AC329F5|nr:glycosyltransferase family 39 protein [Paraburkholderia sp. J41]
MSQLDSISSAAAPRRPLIDLNTPRALALARVLVPVLFGFYSLWLGADANWDLYNYHMYNPFAWLHGKLRVDLAPAGMQSYFNPLLDALFYLANTHLPARAVGFAMGVLHGLSFVFILGIAQHTLRELPERDRYRVPLLLALAGCLTANFLSVLGNSMGDDTTAPFTLAALWLLVAHWERLRAWTIAAGVLAGLAVGLKLTNAVSAVALCAALLFYPARPIVRVRLAFVFGVGVLLGFAATGGYWLFHMWKTFGNPLYPQFAAWFPDPLVQPDAMGDARWRPHGVFETLFWPYIFSVHSQRLGEVPLHQIIWAIVYTLYWLLFAAAGVRRLQGRARATASNTRQRFVLAFVAIGYLVWMEGFSIYRYLVAIEVLTPLAIWLLLQRLASYAAARRIACWCLSIATAVVVAGGARTWGHEPWSDPLWHAEVPALSQPDRTTVVIATTGARAWAWLATFFPDTVAFTQIDSSFPGTPAFGARIREVASARGGPVYAIVDGAYNWRLDNIATMNAIVGGLGLTRGEGGCQALRWTVTRLRLHASVVPGTQAAERCALALRADDVLDTAAQSRANLDVAAQMFARNGFDLDRASCASYRAGIGKGTQIYQWCKLSLHDAR